MSATSTRHAQALADAIAAEMRVSPAAIEGYQNGEWVLLDLGDIVVHVFYEPVRAYYCLDKIWADAPTVDLAEPKSVRRPKASSASART
jgi:ribosome-associated protein